MKKLLHLADSTANKISLLHLVLFLVCLPLDRYYSSIVLISLCFHTAIHFRKTSLQKIDYRFFILSSAFFVSIFAALYAPSGKLAMETVTKQLAVVLFPLIFFLRDIDLKRYRNSLLSVFSATCVFIVLYLYVDAFLVIRYQGLSYDAILSPLFMNHNFSQPVAIHATFLSIFLVLSFLFLLQQFVQHKKWYLPVAMIILLAGIIQLTSKTTWVCLPLIMLFIIPLHIKERSQRVKYIAVSLTVTAGLCFLTLQSAIFRERIFEGIAREFKPAGLASDNSRIERWRASLALIKRSPVIGHGSGAEIPLLKQIYFERKMYVPFLHALNAHNQFLSSLITSGIIGLLIYLLTLAWGFVQALKSKDMLFQSFLLMIVALSFAEDLLDVNKGIFFYAFFFSFFHLTNNHQHIKTNKATASL